MTLKRLVSGAAHEINNLLGAILGRVQLCTTADNLPPEVAADLATIEALTDSVHRIVSDLRSFVHQRPPQLALTDLNQLILRTIELRRYYLRSHGIALHLNLDTALPPALVDPQQIQQVLLNLIINAEQALESVRGCHPEPAPLSISVETALRRQPGAAPMAVLRVIDNGPGIPAAVREQIFEPFFTTKAEGQGTGMGLAIVADIIREHGGNIRVASEMGSGTTMEVRLPLAPSDPAPPAPPVKPLEHEGRKVD